MIDIVQNTERNLRNIQQIGSPDEEDKIYIEKNAYDRIHQEEFAEKRVFVLMGHTECAGGRYTTFAEAAIPVREIEFYQNIPRWNNHSWSEVFQEIKRAYEDYIIVGWAIDIKGMPPKINMEIESIHREQFGGIHQILFLMDSIEKEEFFYINKKNHLRQKSGFYIYYQQRSAASAGKVDIEVELPTKNESKNEDSNMELERRATLQERRATFQEERSYARQSDSIRDMDNVQMQPRYRASMQRRENESTEHHFSSYAMTAAIVLLICIIGVGAYRTKEQMFGLQNAITTLSTQQPNESQVETNTSMESETATSQNPSTETVNPTGIENGTVPVEKVPGIVPESQSNGQAQTNTDSQSNDVQANSVNEGTNALAHQQSEPTQQQAPITKDYTVQKGDTLASISRTLYGGANRTSEICVLNGITDPNQIHYGQTIKVPEK